MNKTADNNAFTISRAQFEPAYLSLYWNGELQRRAEQSIAGPKNCVVCPRECGIDRLSDNTAVCKVGRYARVASYHAHHGEEDCLRGWRGSGTIFFSGSTTVSGVPNSMRLWRRQGQPAYGVLTSAQHESLGSRGSTQGAFNQAKSNAARRRYKSLYKRFCLSFCQYRGVPAIET